MDKPSSDDATLLSVGCPSPSELPKSTDLKAGEGERRVPVRLDLGVDVAAHVQQQLDGR